ncbi:uncharacterized protein C12orf50 homolog [Discoglossus pictus]
MLHQIFPFWDGSNYPFHQCEVVSNSEPVCPIWRKERCPLLHFRNVDMQLRRCTTPCFWENQPAGCVKISCSYFHCKPRNINGLFLPPTSSSNTTLYPVLPFVPPPSTPTPPPPLQHCEDMVSITESSIVDTMIKAYTPERAESCRCIEDLQIKQENLCRPIHPPLIIHLTVTEDDEEEEEDAEDKCFDYCEPRTKTPEEIEEERTIMEICGKAGDYYKVQISHEIHSIISPISQEVKIKLQKPLDTARDLQEGDGLAVPTKLDLERKRNLTLSSIEYPNEYIKTNIGYFAKGVEASIFVSEVSKDTFLRQKKLSILQCKCGN